MWCDLAGCPVNFEFLNYTVITSECKGPHYPADRCCSSFKDFACPYADMLNDLTNDCASTMFSYINLYGRYPPGLFASECREGKEGLECPADAPSASDNMNGATHGVVHSSLMHLLIPACLVFLLRLFWEKISLFVFYFCFWVPSPIICYIGLTYLVGISIFHSLGSCPCFTKSC